MTITKESGRLTSEEIQQMIDDADKYRGADELKKDLIEFKTSFDKYLQISQKTINDSEFPDALTDDEKSYANQLILNTSDWLNAIDPANGQPIERKKEDLIECKASVEYYLKPLINKIYARQMIKGKSEKEATPTITQINQVLETFDHPLPSQTVIKKKINLKLRKNGR